VFGDNAFKVVFAGKPKTKPRRVEDAGSRPTYHATQLDLAFDEQVGEVRTTTGVETDNLTIEHRRPGAQRFGQSPLFRVSVSPMRELTLRRLTQYNVS
jgi:hypothetical protein